MNATAWLRRCRRPVLAIVCLLVGSHAGAAAQDCPFDRPDVYAALFSAEGIDAREPVRSIIAGKTITCADLFGDDGPVDAAVVVDGGNADGQRAFSVCYRRGDQAFLRHISGSGHATVYPLPRPLFDSLLQIADEWPKWRAGPISEADIPNAELRQRRSSRIGVLSVFTGQAYRHYTYRINDLLAPPSRRGADPVPVLGTAMAAVWQRRDPLAAVVQARRDADLRAAMRAKDYRRMEQMLKDGADINSAGRYGFSPLTEAVIKGDAETIRQLVARGARISQPHRPGGERDALVVAAGEDKPEMIRLLLELGADVNSGTVGRIVSPTPGRTISPALLAAAAAGNTECARILIAAGADAGAADRWSRTALGEALENRPQSIALLELLIEHGADVNLANKQGNTPLISLSRNNRWNDNLAAIRLLLKHGADPNAENRRHETPWRLAAKRCDRKLMTLLEQHGAVPDASVLDAKCRH